MTSKPSDIWSPCSGTLYNITLECSYKLLGRTGKDPCCNVRWGRKTMQTRLNDQGNDWHMRPFRQSQVHLCNCYKHFLINDHLRKVPRVYLCWTVRNFQSCVYHKCIRMLYWGLVVGIHVTKQISNNKRQLTRYDVQFSTMMIARTKHNKSLDLVW